MLERLKAAVCEANLRLVREGLVVLTFGNASAVDRVSGCLVIKPSGVAYADLRPESMVVVNLETGSTLEGGLRPSSDTPTHRLLYREFPGLGGIVHTHSLHATAWAQARLDLPPLGTTHADYAGGPIPCTRPMTVREIAEDYETNTGRVMAERLQGANPLDLPGILVAGHGPFAWGATLEAAVEHAVALEFVARLATETLRLAPQLPTLPPALLRKHFLRKHGAGAYYGQTPRAAPGVRS